MFGEVSKKREIRMLAVRNEVPRINVGKNGLTENILGEIDRQLNEHEVVKVKFLKNSPMIDEINVKEIGKKLSIMLKAEVIDSRGKTVTLYRKRKQRFIRNSCN